MVCTSEACDGGMVDVGYKAQQVVQSVDVSYRSFVVWLPSVAVVTDHNKS